MARAARWVAWVLCGLSVVFAAVGAALQRAAHPVGADLQYDPGFFVAFLVFVAVGTVLAVRRRQNPIGWLLLAHGALWELAGVLAGYVAYSLHGEAGSRPGAVLAAWLLSWSWIPTLALVPLLLLLFPEGRLASRRARVLAWSTLVGSVLTLVGQAFRPGSMEHTAAVPNPVGISAAALALAFAEAAGQVVFALSVCGAVALVVVRFRRAGGIERLQLLCLAYAGGLVAIAFTAANVIERLGFPAMADEVRIPSLLALPVAMAVAVLRYRLYDVDLVVDRTVVHGGLVAFITSVYLAVIVGVGAAVGTGAGSNVALTVVATAVVAVAAQPLRQRLQHLARRIVFGRPTTRQAQAGVAIASLGAFRVVRDDGPVPFGAWQSKKARTVLKILVARRGRSTPRELLMEIVWPDEDPAVVSRRLSVALSTVRSVLDPHKRHPPDHFLVGEDDAVPLDIDNLPIDVEELLQGSAEWLAQLRAGGGRRARGELGRIERLYSGDFLEEDAYEDWARPLREEARSAYVTVARTLAETARAAGDLDEAARYLLRVLDQDTWDERAHLDLVAVMEQAGRHGEARRCYQSYESRMQEIRVPVAPFPATGAR